MILKAPFVYFGGKSIIANIVWEVLGQPRTYIFIDKSFTYRLYLYYED